MAPRSLASCPSRSLGKAGKGNSDHRPRTLPFPALPTLKRKGQEGKGDGLVGALPFPAGEGRR